MRFSRPLCFALLLSLCVHLFALSDSDWWPSLRRTPPPPAKLRPLTARLVAQKIHEPAQVSAQATPARAFSPAPKLRPPKRRRVKPAQDASAPLAQRDASAPKAMAQAEASAPMAASAPKAIEASVPAAVVAASAPTADTNGAGHSEGKDQGDGSFPRQIKVRYQTVYNNTVLSGELNWQRAGGRYRLELGAKLFVFSMRYTSEGRIGKNGLVPERFQVFKNGKLQEGADFDWDNKLVHYGADRQNQAPLEPGAQDILSVAWQLAFLGDRLPDSVWLTNGKKAYQYPVKIAGQTEFPQTGGQPVAVIRANAEGNQNEFWLATGTHNLPVRIIRRDDKLNIELSAAKIEIEGRTVWAQD